MGVEQGQFFLSHGGFLDGFTTFGEKFNRDPSSNSLQDIILPAITSEP